MIEDGNLKKRVNLDIEHIINYSIEHVENKVTGQLDVFIHGGHLAGTAEALEATGLIEIIHKEILANGCIEYNLKNTLTGFHFTKTEFPVHWNYKKLVQNCWNVYESSLSTEVAISGGKIAKTGVVDNCKIDLIVKAYPNTHNIITASFPTKK